MKNIEVEEAGFDGFDTAPVILDELNEWFDAVKLGVESKPLLGSIKGNELEIFAVFITEVETEMVAVGTHAGDVYEVDVLEAENGFFIPWPIGFELL